MVEIIGRGAEDLSAHPQTISYCGVMEVDEEAEDSDGAAGGGSGMYSQGGYQQDRGLLVAISAYVGRGVGGGETESVSVETLLVESLKPRQLFRNKSKHSHAQRTPK